MAPFVNQMSPKAWCLRHGFRRLNIPNWRESVHSLKDGAVQRTPKFLTLGNRLIRAKRSSAGELRKTPSINQVPDPMTHQSLASRRAIFLVLAMSGAFAGAHALAADASNAPVLDEIIVTAQKRSENLQDVPISVVAINAQQVQDAGITNIRNLAILTPGLTVTSEGNEAITTARIRGIGTVGDNPGLESSVGVNIDGVYRPRNGVAFGDLGEIEQIGAVRPARRIVRQEQRRRRDQYHHQETVEHLRRNGRSDRRQLQ